MLQYDFLVGDDPTIALGVVVAFALTAALAVAAVPAWWLVPATLLGLPTLSLWRVLHRPSG